MKISYILLVIFIYCATQNVNVDANINNQIAKNTGAIIRDDFKMIYNNSCSNSIEFYQSNNIYTYFKHAPENILFGVNHYTSCDTNYKRPEYAHVEGVFDENTRLSFNNMAMVGFDDNTQSRVLESPELSKTLHSVLQLDQTFINIRDDNSDILTQYYIDFNLGYRLQYPAVYTNTTDHYHESEWFLRSIFAPRKIIIIIDSSSLMFYNSIDYQNAVNGIKTVVNSLSNSDFAKFIFHGCDNDFSSFYNIIDSNSKTELLSQLANGLNCRYETTLPYQEYTLTKTFNKSVNMLDAHNNANDENKYISSIIYVSNGKTDLHPEENVTALYETIHGCPFNIHTVNVLDESNDLLQNLACIGSGSYNYHTSYDDIGVRNILEHHEKLSYNNGYSIQHREDKFTNGNVVSYTFPLYGNNGEILGIYGFDQNVNLTMPEKLPVKNHFQSNQCEMERLNRNKCNIDEDFLLYCAEHDIRITNARNTCFCSDNQLCDMNEQIVEFEHGEERWYDYYENVYYKHCPLPSFEPNHYDICHECFYSVGEANCTASCGYYYYYPCEGFENSCSYSAGCLLKDEYRMEQYRGSEHECYALMPPDPTRCVKNNNNKTIIDETYFCLEIEQLPNNNITIIINNTLVNNTLVNNTLVNNGTWTNSTDNNTIITERDPGSRTNSDSGLDSGLDSGSGSDSGSGLGSGSSSGSSDSGLNLNELNRMENNNNMDNSEKLLGIENKAGAIALIICMGCVFILILIVICNKYGNKCGNKCGDKCGRKTVIPTNNPAVELTNVTPPDQQNSEETPDMII
jgi:hypothetical protein